MCEREMAKAVNIAALSMSKMYQYTQRKIARDTDIVLSSYSHERHNHYINVTIYSLKECTIALLKTLNVAQYDTESRSTVCRKNRTGFGSSDD